MEYLLERRPELLSSVMLRQNPHNVHEWHKRVKLFAGKLHKQILTYTEAVTTVDVNQVPTLTLPCSCFPPSVHGDIKCRNFLANDGWTLWRLCCAWKSSW